MESARNRPTEAAAVSYPTIAATATALPPYTITRDDVKVYMGRVFDIPERRLEAMMSIVDNAQVHKRHSIFPLNYIIEPRPLSQTNNEYIEHAVKLGREAAEKCLERAGLKADEIDMIITVSCTGFMIPSLDAHLINLMGFRPNVRRMPFTELGCAAGAMALVMGVLRHQDPILVVVAGLGVYGLALVATGAIPAHQGRALARWLTGRVRRDPLEPERSRVA